MIYLLDVNVLIALIDPAHIAHDAAHRWFVAHGQVAWATCPITENGVIRIVSHPGYPNTPGSPALVGDILGQMCALPGHRFLPDDISLVSDARFDRAQLLTHAQVTDSYLLALAAAHGGRLATFDRKLLTNAVRGGAAAVHVIDA